MGVSIGLGNQQKNIKSLLIYHSENIVVTSKPEGAK